MADNLKLVEERIDVEIDPTGAPGSILAENHNGIEKEILRKTGKYTGSPFVAKKESTLFPSGTLSWNGNAMNNISNFLITTSKLTSDLTDFGNLLSTMAIGDLIQFKDYSGRTVFLEFQSYVSSVDGSMNPIYEITVKGFADNLNYVYQVNESSVAVLSFIKKIVDLSLLVSKLERLTVPVPNVQNVIELDGENHFIEFQNNGQGFFNYFILGANYIGGQNHPLQFRNATDSPIVLKNMINSGTSIIGETPLFFPNGLNLILEPRETVQFCYNADNNRFDYVGASFEIEISDVNGLQDELDLKASKTYVDGLVVGLLDDRGNYDASTNLFPSTGGSGTSGAILKGDLWYISVSGTLGGQLVNVGDSVRALTDAPGQTSGNWDILESNIGYVPENTSNKSTDIETDKASNIKFPTVKAIYDWCVGRFQNKFVAGTNVSFDTTNPLLPVINVASASKLPLSAFLNPSTGNDLTALIEDPLKPFKTIDALLNALPVSTGETFTIHISGGTVAFTRQVVCRNLVWKASSNATLDFTNVMLADGVTHANCVQNYGVVGNVIWTFEGRNISITCTYVGYKSFALPNTIGGISFQGVINNFSWLSSGSTSYAGSVRFPSLAMNLRTEFTIVKLFDGNQSITIFQQIGNYTVLEYATQYGSALQHADTNTLTIKSITQIGTTTLSLPLAYYGYAIGRVICGNVNFIGTFRPGSDVLEMNGTVASTVNIDFSGAKLISGEVKGTNFHTFSCWGAIKFRNFTGNLGGILFYRGAMTFENCNIKTNTYLLDKRNEADSSAYLDFIGFNNVTQVTTTGPLFSNVNPIPLQINIEGTLKTTATTYGNSVYTQKTLSFKEKSKEVVIRNKSDIVNKVLDSSNSYIIDGDLALSAGEFIRVPAGGLTLNGYGFDASRLGSYGVVNHSIFRSEAPATIIDVHAGLNGTNKGATTGHPGVNGKSMYYSGYDISYGGVTSLNRLFAEPGNPFSVGGFFKMGQVGRFNYIFGNTIDSQTGNLCVYFHSNNNLYVVCRGAFTVVSTIATTNPLNWNYFEVKYDGGTVCTININGVDVNVPIGTQVLRTNHAVDFQIGGAQLNSPSMEGFASNFFAYNRGRTLAESVATYNGGLGLSYAGETKTGLVAYYPLNDNTGGSGNLVIHNLSFTVTGTGSKVFDVKDVDGSHALEMITVNFEGCKSIGRINGYRQGTGITVGFYDCADGLIFAGAWSGFKLTNTNGFSFGTGAVMFKKEDGLTFSNRFYLELNVDIANGMIANFEPANFLSNKLLQVVNTLAKIGGIIDPNNTTALFPNITTDDSKVLFVNNLGLKNSAVEPYAINTLNLVVAPNDADAGTAGVDIGKTYIETGTGYFKVRLT